MTTNQLLYQSILDILRKDERGEAVSVSEFNALLPVVSHEFFSQQYAKFQQTQNITDSLAPFIRTATITLTAGVGYLPADYLHLIGQPTALSGTTTVRVDVVSRLELTGRLTDAITVPSATCPVATLGVADVEGYVGTYGSYATETAIFGQYDLNGTYRPFIAFDDPHVADTGDIVVLSGGRDQFGVAASDYDGTHTIYVPDDEAIVFPNLTYDGDVAFALYSILNKQTISVYPTTVTSVSITYLAAPATPKLDYYVTDATNVRTFLAASATHTADTDAESYPVAVDAPGDGDTYTSETVEMEWLAQDRPAILALFLSKLGVTLQDQTLAGYGMQTAQINNR